MERAKNRARKGIRIHFKSAVTRRFIVKKWRSGGTWTRRRPLESRKRISSPVLAEQAKETERMREFPGIAFRGKDKRAWVVGTPFDVWEIVEEYRTVGLKGMLEEGDIPEDKMLLALSYYRAHPFEVDADINENRGIIEREMESKPELVFQVPQD